MLGFHINTVSEWVDNFRWSIHCVLQPVRLFLGIICLPHCPAALLALVPVLEYQACFSPFPCSGHLHDSIIPAPSLYSPYSVLDCLGLLHASDTASLVLSFRKFSNQQCVFEFLCACNTFWYPFILPFLSSWQWFLLFALYSGDQLLS